jgi:hypothetical protein
MANCRALGAACNQASGCGHGRDGKPIRTPARSPSPPAPAPSTTDRGSPPAPDGAPEYWGQTNTSTPIARCSNSAGESAADRLAAPKHHAEPAAARVARARPAAAATPEHASASAIASAIGWPTVPRPIPTMAGVALEASAVATAGGNDAGGKTVRSWSRWRLRRPRPTDTAATRPPAAGSSRRRTG